MHFITAISKPETQVCQCVTFT